MSRFGFKEINSSNWLEPEDFMRAFVRIDPRVGPVEMEAKDWVEAITSPRPCPPCPKTFRLCSRSPGARWFTDSSSILSTLLQPSNY